MIEASPPTYPPLSDKPLYYVVSVEEKGKPVFAICQRLFDIDPSELPDVPGTRTRDILDYISKNKVDAAAIPALLEVLMKRSGDWRSGNPVGPPPPPGPHGGG